MEQRTRIIVQNVANMNRNKSYISEILILFQLQEVEKMVKEPAEIPKTNTKLSVDTIRAIEAILSLKETAKVLWGKDGITVYKENRKKMHTQS